MSTVLERSASTTEELADIKGRTLRGGAVTTVVQITTFVLRTVSTIILARLLSPTDFGLVAMVVGITGFFELFKDAGLSMATVQRKEITQQQISTLFWINILIGTLLTVGSMALAPALVAFYGEPRLFTLTIALACGFIISAAGVQHRALLQRRMEFVTLGMIDILGLVGSLSVGVGLSIAGFRYWALAAMALSVPLVQTLSCWVANPWMPGLPSRRCGVRSMLHFGGTLTLNAVLVYVAYNIDKILLGHYWGAGVLGLFSRAQTLINLPTTQLNTAVGSVAFPALSRLQSDEANLKKYFLKGYSLILSLTIPITIVCGLFAQELVLLLLGRKWTEAIPVFRLLVPAALSLAFINPFGWLLMATGQVGRSLRMAVLIAMVLVPSFVLGLSYGGGGVAVAWSVAMTLLVVPLIQWAKWGGSIKGKDVLEAARRPLVAGILAGIAGLIYHVVIGETLAVHWRLAIGLALVFGLYACILLFAMGQKRFYLDVLRHLMPALRAADSSVNNSR